jgi:hypothetical protein
MKSIVQELNTKLNLHGRFEVDRKTDGKILKQLQTVKIFSDIVHLD